MKKISYLLAFVLAFVSFAVVGCGNPNAEMTTIKVNEVTHSIFYAPFYVAINKGYFADEKIEIE